MGVNGDDIKNPLCETPSIDPFSHVFVGRGLNGEEWIFGRRLGREKSDVVQMEGQIRH